MELFSIRIQRTFQLVSTIRKGAAFPACILSKSGPGIERKGGECSQVCKRQLSLRETFL